MDGHDQAMPNEPIQTSSPTPRPPAPPNPAADKGIVPPASSDIDSGWTDSLVLSDIPAITALKMFSGRLEELARVTGDVSSFPLFRIDTNRNRPIAIGPGRENGPDKTVEFTQVSSDRGVESADSSAANPRSGNGIGAGAGTDDAQQDALARRFFSKTAPGVSLVEYLLRLHKFCPMPTAIYLATSHYINKLVIVEEIVPVTPRSVHRLALAGLRVAMKALEDLSYPHHRFAKVGGVTEDELRKLEIGFCFLTDFDLVVDTDTLLQEAKTLSEGMQLATSSEVPGPAT